MRERAHTYTHTHHTLLQSTDGHRNPRHTQTCAPTNTSQAHLHHTHQHELTRPHTPLPLMHTHHTGAQHSNSHCSRVYALTLSRRAHTLLCTPTPSCTGTQSVHTFTPRAHTLLRTHTSSRARAHTPSSEGRGGWERPSVPGHAWPGEGAAQGPRAAQELFAGAETGRRWRGRLPAPAALGWAARRERVPGPAGAHGPSAPWTARRAAARRRMTAWTRAPRPEGEPDWVWVGGALRVARRLLSGPDGPGPSGGAGAAAAEGGGRGGRSPWPPEEAGGAAVSPPSPRQALRAESRGPRLPGAGRAHSGAGERKDSRSRDRLPNIHTAPHGSPRALRYH